MKTKKSKKLSHYIDGGIKLKSFHDRLEDVNQEEFMNHVRENHSGVMIELFDKLFDSGDTLEVDTSYENLITMKSTLLNYTL